MERGGGAIESPTGAIEVSQGTWGKTRNHSPNRSLSGQRPTGIKGEIQSTSARGADSAFNHLVLQALPKFRLRGVKFGRADSWHAELSNLTVKMASEMRIRYNLLFYFLCYFNPYSGTNFIRLRDLMATGRHLDKRLELQGWAYFLHVDQIVKLFEEDVRSLEGAIRDVRYENPNNEGWSVDWPAGTRCPREAATQVRERNNGTVEHSFDYTNKHSNEPFSLLLGTRHHKGRTHIYKFRLNFGSA